MSRTLWLLTAFALGMALALWLSPPRPACPELVTPVESIWT